MTRDLRNCDRAMPGLHFEQAMDDDFNTPVAIAELQGLRSE